MRKILHHGVLENRNSDYFNKLIKELVKINWENKSNVID